MLPRKIALIFGVLILILIPVWSYFVLPLITALPVNFTQKANLTHTEDNRFTIGGRWSGQKISTGETLDTVDKAEYRKAFVSSKFDVRSLVGESLFLLDQDFVVDRLTLKNGESYFLFPRHTPKSIIRWWPGKFGEPIDLTFIDEVFIEGLRIYHFRGERTDINDTAGYEFLPMVPQKYLVLSRATLDVYVEPSSGMVVDYKDEGVSYYAGLDKSPIWDLAKWSNKFTDTTIESRFESATETRQRLFILEVLVPLILLLLSLLFLNYSVSRKKRVNHKKR